MRVLLDTDVIIDVALDRLPHSEYSAIMLDMAESFRIDAYIAWHSIANFYYLVSGASGDKKARQFIKDLLRFTIIPETSTSDAVYAVESTLKDFEDALQVAAAQKCSAEYIITRNIRHYKNSKIPAINPEQFLENHLSR